MIFPISGAHLHPAVLVVVGFIAGVLGGIFGVGGSFIAGPALFGLGLPMNFTVGTDLAHIVGKSIVAVRRHHALGHVDFKLGALMLIGTIPGVECGARLIEHLKRNRHVNQVVGVTFIAILVGISIFMAWESWKTLQAEGRGAGSSHKGDRSAFSGVTQRIQGIALPPFVSLPTSGIARISLWTILGVSLVGGFFSGFLGGGAGYIRMPSMVYLLGIPTHIAVGTDLLEIIFSAGYGTVSHALKGNVDILIALIMHTGAALGAQFGAALTQYLTGPRIRLAFIPLPLIGAGLVIYGLISGHSP